MIAAPNLQRVESIPFDKVLAEAVVLSWNDLTPDSKAGLIHVEYHVGSRGSVEYLKVWGSTSRGDWNLICEYWMHSGISNQSGLRIGNGDMSAELGRALESVMQHPDRFLTGPTPGSDHMIQVRPPTEADKVAASNRASALYDRLAA